MPIPLQRMPPTPHALSALFADYLRQGKRHDLSFRVYLEVRGFNNPPFDHRDGRWGGSFDGWQRQGTGRLSRQTGTGFADYAGLCLGVSGSGKVERSAQSETSTTRQILRDFVGRERFSGE